MKDRLFNLPASPRASWLMLSSPMSRLPIDDGVVGVNFMLANRFSRGSSVRGTGARIFGSSACRISFSFLRTASHKL